MLENQAKIAFLSLGSNLGNRKKYIESAKLKLQSYNIEILKISSNYETFSWPDKKNPKFINLVLKIKTFFSPKKLMKICLVIERELDRKRRYKNQPRTCDIDIIDYDQKIVNDKHNQNLILPHQNMHKRSFVLLPLFEIEKSWIHPLKKQNIKELLTKLNTKQIRSIKLM